MQVKLYASLRQAAGTKMMDVEFQSEATIGDILVEVTRRFPVLEKSIWKAPGELTEYVHVFINGENIRHRSGLETTLKPDDHVDIFPPLVGGSMIS
jgi:molybdopterin synthase sulfur carrier subunit